MGRGTGGAARRGASPRGNGRLSFLVGFLKRPALVGSAVPSSRFLERRIVAAAGVGEARVVVELGPGTGGTTRALLEALPPEGRLLAIEINRDFAACLAALRDPRLALFWGSAAEIRRALEAARLQAPDIVVSGIPFSTIPAELGRRILAEIWGCLAPGGRFVSYQVMGRVARLAPELLGPPCVQIEPLNLPPLRVYLWRKPA